MWFRRPPPTVNLVEVPPGSAGRSSKHQSCQSRAVSKDLVGSKPLPHCDCNSETKVDTPALHFPPVPHASRWASHVPTGRCDLWPSGVSLCLIRPSTSCSLANWPPSLWVRARAPPGSVCSVPFLGQWWMPTLPGRPPKLHQSGGLNRFRFFFFFRRKGGWMSVITYNLKF